MTNATESHRTRPPETPAPDLDGALAEALRAATAAGDLALVARIVGLVEARRREAAGNVVTLDTKRWSRS